MEGEPALRILLLWGVYPAWLIAGALDWWCHRESHIDSTSGVTESWFHVLQFVSIGAFLCVVLLLPYSALTAAVALALVIVHTALSYVDVRFTLPRRHISALEQHVHGFLDVLPWIACALWIVINLQGTSAENVWRPNARGNTRVAGQLRSAGWCADSDRTATRTSLPFAHRWLRCPWIPII